jgi:phosphatidylserine/phosphatidylglycerophosphate/cardiolipin synthase-like enzyme
MSVVHPGDGLLELVRSATTRIVVAAPYIKSRTLRRLISVLPNSVTTFICVTRWLPEDIASGVCDLEIFDDVLSMKGGVLLVYPHLHAKYYAAGARCLVGSANLTGRGLGWNTPPNIELLVALPADFAGLPEWEAALLESSVVATLELRAQLRKEADRLKAAASFRSPPEVEETDTEEVPALWVPMSPVPERLWLVYQGRGADRMVSSAYEAAQHDLAALRPPDGLTQELFEAYIAGILRQMPLMAEIDRMAAAGMTDSQALAFLTERLPASGDMSHDQAWRVLKLWLMHFFPKSYRLETGQEVLVKGKELSRR